MRTVTGTMREAMRITSLEENIEKDDEIRIIDEIVETLNLEKLGYREKARKSEAGRPKYEEKVLLKLYLYGYRNGIRSGQKLENACKYDIRVQWLLEGRKPDKNTINDFRKDNSELLKNVFYEVNKMYIEMGILKIKNVSQDGFKIKASNSKEKNYTINKLVERIKRESKSIEKNKEVKEKLEEEKKKTEKYIECLDKAEELEEIEAKIEDAQKELEEIEARKEKHEKLLNMLKETGESQVSITDKESRLMPNNGKFEVCYNNQATIDIETHLAVGITTDNNPADVGSMSEMMDELKEHYEIEGPVTNTTDKGYQSVTDMMECLEKGMIPQVTPNHKETEEIELSTIYEENEISEESRKSRKAEDIKKCLRAGVIPECLEENVTDIKIEEVEERVSEKEEEEETRSGEEIREEAIAKQTFERDMNSGLVYCPMGEILGKKSTVGEITRYCNKLACKNCKNPCTECKYKEVGFKEGQKTVVPVASTAAKPRRKYKEKIKVKKVKIKLQIKKENLKRRMQTSEHSQGTMKTYGNFASFSMRGKEKVRGETALYFTASNIRRVKNMLGTEEILKRIEKYREKSLETKNRVKRALKFLYKRTKGQIILSKLSVKEA